MTQICADARPLICGHLRDLWFDPSALNEPNILMELTIGKTWLRLRLQTAMLQAVLPGANKTSGTNKGLDVASLSEGV